MEPEQSTTTIHLRWQRRDTGAGDVYRGPLPVTIGRAPDNAVVLEDGRVSRHHARLEAGRHGLVLTDLKSANGVGVNGQGIKQAPVTAEDRIQIGPYDLTLLPQPPAGAPTTIVHPQPTARQPRFVLRWIEPGTGEAQAVVADAPASLGRDKDNTVILPSPKISRRHAVITAEGDHLVLRDQNSTNGIYVNGRRQTETPLKLGDVIRMGDYSLTLLPLGAKTSARTAPPPQMTVGSAVDTGVGRAGSVNEDRVGSYSDVDPTTTRLFKKGFLFVLADGMGGAAGGQVASEIAVDKVLEGYYEDPESDPDLADSLEKGIQKANVQIHRQRGADDDVRKMGTTIVAAAVRGDRLVVANAGDSRVYLCRSGKLRRLTKDHTWVQQLLESGMLRPEEAPDHPYRHVLTRNLGGKPRAEAEYRTTTLQEGDVIMLCSDGLWSMLSEDTICNVLQSLRGEAAAKSLIEIANERGAPDNVSVIVLHVDWLPAGSAEKTVQMKPVTTDPNI